jgi:proline iminopeptidase
VGLRTLYPQLSAHDSGYLKVSQLHTLYYEVYGNPRGVPAVVVHGGPGAGCWPNHARFFDPAHYRIILVDQRGCGRSTPYGCLAGNTTAELVNDLEQLRRKLGVQQWLMLGGSWGVTLTLAYAQVGQAACAVLLLASCSRQVVNDRIVVQKMLYDGMYKGSARQLPKLSLVRQLVSVGGGCQLCAVTSGGQGVTAAL